jgi:hypothetical protein
MLYRVYQNTLTDMQRKLVNSDTPTGNALFIEWLKAADVPLSNETKAVCNMQSSYQFKRHTYDVEAESLEEVFTLTNGMDGPGKIINTYISAHSCSVGDVVLVGGAADNQGGWICAAWGWVQIPEKVCKEFMCNVASHMRTTPA